MKIKLKKILSTVMVILMIFTLIPAMAFAENSLASQEGEYIDSIRAYYKLNNKEITLSPDRFKYYETNKTYSLQISDTTSQLLFEIKLKDDVSADTIYGSVVLNGEQASEAMLNPQARNKIITLGTAYTPQLSTSVGAVGKSIDFKVRVGKGTKSGTGNNTKIEYTSYEDRTISLNVNQFGLNSFTGKLEDGTRLFMSPIFEPSNDAMSLYDYVGTVPTGTSAVYLTLSPKKYIADDGNNTGNGLDPEVYDNVGISIGGRTATPVSGDTYKVDLADYTDESGKILIPFATTYNGSKGSGIGTAYSLTIEKKDVFPQITKDLSGEIILCNKNDKLAALSVEAESPVAGGIIGYQWYKNNSKIKKATNAEYTPDTNVATQATYYCEITNTVNGVSYPTKSSSVIVKVNPTVITAPKIASIKVDGGNLKSLSKLEKSDTNVTYKVTWPDTYMTEALPDVKWYGKDISEGASGEPEYLGEGKVLSQDGASISCLFTIKGKDAGTKYEYWCEATVKAKEEAGSASATTQSAKITVQYTSYKDIITLEGAGSEENPYKISSIDDLERIKTLVESGYSLQGLHFALQNDIELPSDWEPIGRLISESSKEDPEELGKNVYPFSGIFDGKDASGKVHKVTVAKPGKPLFNYVREAEIRNLEIYGEQIDGYGLVDKYFVDYGTDGKYNTGCPQAVTIENVVLKEGSKVLKSGFIGGYASGANTVYITNCTVEPDVEIGYDGTQSNIGSFAGDFNGYITNCVSYATVKGEDAVGGIVGAKGQSMGPCNITNSEFYGTVSASGQLAGGILGSGYRGKSAPLTPVASVKNCLVTGNIEGATNVGGIFGGEPVCENCQDNGQGIISDNVFVGTVNAKDENGTVGNIIGLLKSVNKNQTISQNYYLADSNEYSGIGKIEKIISVSDNKKTGIDYVFNADKVCISATAKSMSNKSIVKELNNSKTSLKNWIQGDSFPVHSSVPVPYKIDLIDGYKTIYYVSEPLDTTSIIANVTYSDGSVIKVGASELTLSGFDSKSVGYKNITVSYKNAESSFKVLVIAPEPKSMMVYFTLYGDKRHGESGEIHTLRGGNLETWIPKTSFTITENQTVKDVFEKALEQNNISWSNPSGNYVKSITYKFLELSEWDNGTNSGWMYTLNGTHPLLGVAEQFLNDGDEIVFHYTDDYTKEEGSEKWGTPGADEVKDVTTSGAAGAASTTAPTEVKVSGTTAAATVKAENQSEILKQAAEHKSAEIVLKVAASDTKGAENVQLQLETSFVKNISDKTNARLILDTANGRVSFDQEALKAIIGEAKGSTIIIEIAKVTKPTEAQKKAAGTNGDIFRLLVKSGDKIISEFNKGKATVRVEIPAKLADKKVAAIYIADDAKIEQLAGKTLTVSGKKFYEFTTPHFSAFALVDAEELGLEVKEEPAVDVKTLTAKLTPVARSAKTAKKNVKVTTSLDKQDKAIVQELKDAGYTVKYRFYRSTKKAAGYKAAVTKKTSTYTNTGGKKGTKYYYKVQVRVYDADGKLAAKTALKQCKYASRTWTKGK